MASPVALRTGSVPVSFRSDETASSSMKIETVSATEAVNSSSIIDDPSNFDVNAQLLINLDTSGIHTPTDITLLTQFGDNDEENDSFSSTGSPEDSNLNNNYNNVVYSTNPCSDLDIPNEDLGNHRENQQKSGTTQDIFSGNHANTSNYLQLSCDNNNYESWNTQRVNSINGSNDAADSQQYLNNFNYQATNCGMANQGQCFPTYAPAEQNQNVGLNQSINRTPMTENICRHNYTTHPVNMFNNANEQQQQPIQQIISPWMANVNNYSNCIPQGMGTPNWINANRMNKCGITETNGWCGNFEKANVIEDPNFRSYSKPSAAMYNNRYPLDERLSTYVDPHGLGTATFGANPQPLKQMNGSGYCGFVVPFNSHWQLLNVNENCDQKSMVGDPKMLSPQPMNCMRPNFTPRSSMPAQNRPQFNYQSVPIESSQTTYMPVYLQLPYTSAAQKLQYQQQSVANMYRCNLVERSAESQKVLSNNALDMSMKPVQLPRTILQTDNTNFNSQPLNISASTDLQYEQHNTVSSVNYLPNISQANCFTANLTQPANSIRETLLNSKANTQQNCVVYSNISNHLAGGNIVKQNAHQLPPFQENFGASAMEALSKRSKNKTSYVTVKQLLLSRRNEVSSAGDQTQERGTEASAETSATQETDKSIITTNASGGNADTVVTKSISVPISSVLEARRKRRGSPGATSKSNQKLHRKKPYKSVGKKSLPKYKEVPMCGKVDEAKAVIVSKPPLSILQTRLLGLPIESAPQINQAYYEGADQDSHSLTSIESKVAEIHGVKQPKFQMYLMNESRRNEYRPPRHYDLLCLTLGSFRVVQSVSAPASNKLKVYFIKKSFVYEFDISHLRLRETVASIEVPFSIVTAIHCEDGEVLISVAAAPKLYLGVKQKRSGAVKSVAQFDKEHPTDITDGQLGKCRTHQLNLKPRQAENLRNYLIYFEESFKDLLDDPICLDEGEDSLAPLPIKTLTKQMLPQINYPEKIPKVIVTVINCHCQVSCRTNRCSCMKSKSKCGLSGSGCLCRRCDNPLNILEDQGVDLMRVLVDNCLIQKIVNFKGDLLKLLNTEVRLECCQTKSKVKFCIPGKNICENSSCEKKLSFKYSWCQQELCYEDVNPRNHCFSCKACKDPIDLHCEVCRKCNPIGGNGARCTFCGNVRDTTLTENDVMSALMRYRNGPAASPKVYQAVQVANKATFCRLETTSDSLNESLDNPGSPEENSQVDL